MIRSLPILVLMALAVAPSLAHSEQKVSKRALLAADTVFTTETAVQSYRKLLCFAGSCVRGIAKVQSHKNPSPPKLSRKSFDRKFPKRALLAVETDVEVAIDTLAEGGRKLLCFAGSCVRGIAKVQSHKNPSPPKLSRKSFDRKFPKRALLDTNTGDNEPQVLERTRA